VPAKADPAGAAAHLDVPFVCQWPRVRQGGKLEENQPVLRQQVLDVEKITAGIKNIQPGLPFAFEDKFIMVIGLVHEFDLDIAQVCGFEYQVLQRGVVVVLGG